MKLKDQMRLLAQGGPGFVQIALTNACNAHCRFCSFPQVKPEDRVMADPERLGRGLQTLAAVGVRYLVFTGGEPLLYPHLEDILTEARDLGFHSLLCTNARLLNQERIQALHQAGVSHLIISIDAASEQEHDQHRGLPGLCCAIRTLLPHINHSGMIPVASVTISRLFSDFEVLGDFLARLGFNLATFSYPVTKLHSSYMSYAAHDSVTFSPEEMVAIFKRLKGWKTKAPITILNPSLGITELQRQLCGLPLRFPCLAGSKYFYIDWHLQVYRCHYLHNVLGSLEDFAALPRESDDCHACLIDCYRDASVQQYLAVALGDAWGELCRGKWGKALGRLMHPETFLSLGAILESRHWLGGNGR
jgi:MoaA/NifB/PqqE/SkfB family radical SAM enzyme